MCIYTVKYILPNTHTSLCTDNTRLYLPATQCGLVDHETIWIQDTYQDWREMESDMNMFLELMITVYSETPLIRHLNFINRTLLLSPNAIKVYILTPK